MFLLSIRRLRIETYTDVLATKATTTQTTEEMQTFSTRILWKQVAIALLILKRFCTEYCKTNLRNS